MKNYLLPFIVIFLLSCKTQQVVSTQSEDNEGIEDTLITSEIDTITYYVTLKGDTLYSLKDSVSRNTFRVIRDSIHLAAVGDIMMGTNFPNSSYLPADEGRVLWKEVKSSLDSADITFGNLEGTILTKGGDPKECKNPKACYLFRTPEFLSYHFKDAGFDILSIANNHANDFGKEGRLNTQKVLDSLGILHAGSIEKPYTIVRRKDIVVGLLAMSPNKGTVLFHDEKYAIEIVNLLDSITDIVIVSLHIGAEGAINQNITRKTEFYYGEDRGNVYELSRLLIDEGADLILGHGPHVVRALDIYKDRLIIYSMGNFLTYGRFNLRGPLAYAPIFHVNLKNNGEFLSGNIESFIQDYNFGPIKDSKQRAVKKIMYLTENDFPESDLKIDESGKISYLKR